MRRSRRIAAESLEARRRVATFVLIRRRDAPRRAAASAQPRTRLEFEAIRIRRGGFARIHATTDTATDAANTTNPIQSSASRAAYIWLS